jgi:hypothetical protein
MRFLSTALLLSALGCSPKPPEGFPVYEQFAERLAKADVQGAHAFVVESATFEVVDHGSSEPAEHGSVKYTPVYDAGLVGPVAWVRHKIESQTKEADGSVRFAVTHDVCHTNPQQGPGAPCAIPDQFRHRVLLEQEGADWKVGGLTEEVVFRRR